jgi:hypothetical protein
MKTNQNRAPGPWTFESRSRQTVGDDYIAEAEVFDAKGRTICDIRECFAEEENDATTRLIAAAPEMLDALKKNISFLDCARIFGAKPFRQTAEFELERFRKIIAKVEGGTVNE